LQKYVGVFIYLFFLNRHSKAVKRVTGVHELFNKNKREKLRWLERVADQPYLTDTIPGDYLEEFVNQNLVTVRRGLVIITVRGQIEVHRRRFGEVRGSGIVTYGEEASREHKFVEKFVKWIWGIDSR